MSRWSLKAIERLGDPQPGWVSIYGPTQAEADAVRSVDLGEFTLPLSDMNQTMERDLFSAALGSIRFDLVDSDGSVAPLLGPTSDTLATESRYFSPWLQAVETWGEGQSAVRWLAVVNETSLETIEDEGLTHASAQHASQLLSARKLSGIPALLRPYPRLPTVVTDTFLQSTAGTLLHAKDPSYVVPGTDLADEEARWAAGSLSWYVTLKSQETWRTVVHPDGTTNPRQTYAKTYDPPAPAAPALSIGTGHYTVSGVAWGPETTIESGNEANGSRAVYAVTIISLAGAPNIQNPPASDSVGATISWDIPEQQRTHYVLRENVPDPVDGSDGQQWLALTCVDQIVQGDMLTITFLDSTSGAQRRSTLDVKVVDIDGETGRVYLLEPLSQGLTTAHVSKIRRNSTDPVYVDAIDVARIAVAPFALDVSQLLPAITDVPVVSWVPLTAGNPHLYGVHDIQPLDRAGRVRFSRRGGIEAGASPASGCWEGSLAEGWAWVGLGTPANAALPLQQLGALTQWPEGTNDLYPPVVWTAGDLSGGATIPVNGWKHPWRSHRSLTLQAQVIESTWDGADVTWDEQSPAGVIPATLATYAAQTLAPGRYTFHSGTWTFQSHVGAAALGPSATIVPGGTSLAGSHLLALGMGIYAGSAGHEEGLQVLTTDTTSEPFGEVKAAVLSCGAAGALTVRSLVSLWTSAGDPVGPWSLGGGLAIHVWPEEFDGVTYAHSHVYFPDGSGNPPLELDLPAHEVLAGTVVPLTLTGTGADRTVGGWYCLALESYADSNAATARRLKFLHLSPQLEVLNGDLVVDPASPDDPSRQFLGGEVLADPIPDGAYPARMVRTGEAGDVCLGFAGGRVFRIAYEVSRCLERVPLGDLDALALLNQLAPALLATAIPQPDGTLALVSRRAGTVRTRDFGGGSLGGVAPGERGRVRTTQVQQPLASEVRVGYTNPLTDTVETVTVRASRQGGKPLDLPDLSAVFTGPTQARAIGRGAAYFLGTPARGRTEEWTDLSWGTSGDAAPVWWASYQLGDVIPEIGQAGDSVDAWKLLQLVPTPDGRKATVELQHLPDQVVLAEPGSHFMTATFASRSFFA